MVLEGEWQQERELARRIETWRVELGQKLSSEIFLTAARYALFSARWIARDGVRHLHAMTTRELLCGWMLRKLCGITLSVTLEEKSPHLPELRGRQARRGVRWRAHPGDGFASETRPSLAGPLSRHKHGRAIEPEWLVHLEKWGASPK